MTTDLGADTVLIVGGGIIGPVLALLLKKKGWNPVIVEKVKNVGASGLAIAIHPNGLKVLDQAGAAHELLKGTVPWLQWNEYTSDGENLGGPGSELPFTWVEKYGWPAVGISRTRIQLCLRQLAIENGIRYEQGWRLEGIEETDGGIVATAEGGRRITASFLVGCDGLKSATRELLLARKGIENKDPGFTGMAVMGGTCPTPSFLQRHQGVNNWYGATTCVISHPLENSMSVWGLNYVPDSSVSESWRTVPQNELREEVATLQKQFQSWPEPVGQLISGSTKIQTIGLYDRPELAVENWYHNRIMLLGDAAHPTTPHIGQGANQGLEDCWTLAQLLPSFQGEAITTQALETIFHKVAAERQPRTSRLVKAARSAGEDRVIRGGEEDVKGRLDRNEKIRKSWMHTDALIAMQDGFYQAPFEDLGGYDRVARY